MSENPVRVHIWVTGRVQGVGFRAFVASSAAYLNLTGWVRNVSWDTVETLAQGSREQVDQFVQALKNGPRASRVDHCRVEEETTGSEFTSFEIRSSR